MKKSDAWWLEYCLECIRTGSRVICNPPPTDTDDDYLLLIDEVVYKAFDEALKKDGYVIGGSVRYSTEPSPLQAFPPSEDMRKKNSNIFRSYKKGEINLIVTASEEFFTNFMKATMLAIEMNLQRKQDRVALFHSLCTDTWPIKDWVYIKG